MEVNGVHQLYGYPYFWVNYPFKWTGTSSNSTQRDSIWLH